MNYLSKGAVLKASTTQNLCVTLCGKDYLLTGIGAKLWLDGRFQCSSVTDARELRHLEKLAEMGLVEISEKNGTNAHYELLTRCIICPAKEKQINHPLTSTEAKAWKWIAQAGLRLSIGELVKLFESGTDPTSELLGAGNAQDLTLLLYRDDLNFDTTLEIKMEDSPQRDKVVNTVMKLLRKKRIILS